MTYFNERYKNACNDVKRAIKNSSFELVYWDKNDDGSYQIVIKTNKEAPMDKFLIKIQSGFPFAPCKIYVATKDKSLLKGLPGIDDNFLICAINYSITRPNPNCPGEVVLDLINKAIKRIENGLNGSKNYNDYVDEFYSYWALKSSKKDLTIMLDYIKDSTLLKAYEISPNLYIISNDEIKNKKIYNTLYFETDKDLINPNEKIVIQNILSDKQLKLFNETNQSICFIIIKFIKENISLGLSLDNKERYQLKNIPYTHYDKINSILNNAAKIIITLFNSEKFYGRAGQGQSIKDEKVVTIIGAGAIGSNLAHYLQLAGISNFTIIDPEILEYENIGRHIANTYYVGRSKADTVKHILETKFPLTKCTSITKDYVEELQKSENLFFNSNLIIDATGNPTSQYALLQWLLNNEYNKSIVFCGVEAYMVMGHLIIANKDNAKDIIKLYDNDFLYQHRLLENPKSKKEAGCVPYYVEYGGLDFQEYVLKSARIITAILKDKLTDGIYAMTGDISDEFIKQKSLEIKEFSKIYIEYDGLKSYTTYRYNTEKSRWDEYDIHI